MRRITKISNFRSVATFCAIITGTGLAFHSSNSNSISPHFGDQISTAVNAFRRSSRAISTISLVVLDYKYSLHGVVANSEEYRLKLSEVHLRSAKRLLKLCQDNKGFYVKAGQFAASLRQTPNEYSSILSSLLDQAAPCPFKDIKDVIISNLGSDISAYQQCSDLYMINEDESPPISVRLRELANNFRLICSSTSSVIPNSDAPSTDVMEPNTSTMEQSSQVQVYGVANPTTSLGTFSQRNTGSATKSLVDNYLRFLNTANKEELKTLKSIGEKRAMSIIELRKESPEPFKSIKGLMKKEFGGLLFD